MGDRRQSANVGVRRLSLVLGLVGAVPAAVFFGVFLLTPFVAEDTRATYGDYAALGQAVKQVSPDLADMADAEVGRWYAEKYSHEVRVEGTESVLAGLLKIAEAMLKTGVATAVAFLIPWGAVRVIAWVVEGFRH